MALVLATAAVIGDKRAAKRHYCTARSVRRWRAECETNEGLSVAVQRARARLEADWQKEVPAALVAAIDFIARSAEHGDPKDPDMLEAMSRAAERLANAEIAARFLDARISAQNRDAGSPALAVVAPRKAG